MDIKVYIEKKETKGSIYITLHLPKDKGALAPPVLKKHFFTRHLICWCTDEYVWRWKNLEIGIKDVEVKKLTTHKGLFGTLGNQLDSITKTKLY